MLAPNHPYAETICISSSTNRIIRTLKRFLWLARQMARRNRIHSTMRDWLMLRSAVLGESRQRRTNPWTYRSIERAEEQKQSPITQASRTKKSTTKKIKAWSIRPNPVCFAVLLDWPRSISTPRLAVAPPEHSGSLRGLSNKASTPGTCRTILVDGKSAISILSRAIS